MGVWESDLPMLRRIDTSIPRLHAGMPEAAVASGGIGKAFDLHQVRPDDGSYHQLGDPIAPADDEGLAAVIDENYLYDAPIVGVDRARCVDHADTVPEREPAPRAHLGFEAFGYRHAQAGRDQSSLAGLKDDIGIQGGKEVHTRRARGGILRQREVLGARFSLDEDGSLKSHGLMSDE